MWNQEYPYSLDKSLSEAIRISMDNGDHFMAESIFILMRRYKGKNLYRWEKDGWLMSARDVKPEEVLSAYKQTVA